MHYSVDPDLAVKLLTQLVQCMVRHALDIVVDRRCLVMSWVPVEEPLVLNVLVDEIAAQMLEHLDNAVLFGYSQFPTGPSELGQFFDR